jgi:aminoglycoside phosphotransferase (APT) family kinase protein
MPMDTTAPLAIGGNRLRWDELPGHIRAETERGLGAPVVTAQSREGGFSPSLASVLTLADGTRVFVKACNPARNDFAPNALRREARVLPRLPVTVPAPRLKWFHDDGEWVVLAIEAVDGKTPAFPWVPDELSRFLAAATELADSLTPAPFDTAPLSKVFRGEFDAWQKLAADPAGLDPWLRAHVDRLAGVAEGWAEASAGDSLLHGDFRADNLLLTADGFTVVDWPSVTMGARWIDLLVALPSVAMHGGGDPEALWSAHPLSREADPQAVDALLAGAAALFISRSMGPPVPLLPTIRHFQRAQGLESLRWLASRRGWDAPEWTH